MGVAPHIKTEFWLFAGNDFCLDLKNWTDTILADDSAPQVHSISYGWQGNLTQVGCNPPEVSYIDDNFAALAAKGISIIFASGDSGSGWGRCMHINTQHTTYSTHHKTKTIYTFTAVMLHIILLWFYSTSPANL